MSLAHLILHGTPTNTCAVASSPIVDIDLPRRLRQVLSLLREGDSEKQIAHKLSISIHTVHIYTKDLYRMFDVSSRGELMAIWASERAWGQRTAEMDELTSNRTSAVSQELFEAARHLELALAAARREGAEQSDRSTIAALKSLVDATLKRVEG